MRVKVMSFMAAQEEVFQMLIILSETLDFDSVLNSVCVWPYSYQGKTQMLLFICLFETFWTNPFISPVSRLFSLCLYLLRPGRTNAMVGSKTAYLTRFYIGACGPEIAKSREMAWGRHSIQFPKHSAMPGGCLKKSFGNQLRKSMMQFINNVTKSMM